MSLSSTHALDLGAAADTSESWFVVQTKRHYEERARARLEAAGVETYLPRTVRWPRPAVGSAIGPLFPTYLFVRMSLSGDYQHYRKVCWTPGVKDFVRLGGELPTEVPERVIEFLRSREGKDGIVRCGDDAVMRRKVKITRGPFKDLCGIVDRKLSSGDRVVLLMDLLHRQVRVEVPEASLREAP